MKNTPAFIAEGQIFTWASILKMQKHQVQEDARTVPIIVQNTPSLAHATVGSL